jgi:Na+/H+ antiporter NhaD/arsenite permease-like protein
VNKSLTIKGLTALALFAGLAMAGVSLAGAAMCAAAALMVAARTGARDVFQRIDWTLLAFFAGLFVVVAGVAHAGVLRDVFEAVAPVVARGDLTGDVCFIAFIVLASNVVSNVPLVLVAVGWIPHMPEPTWGYIMLAVASTLAGNLTLFGSVANIIVMESAGPRGEISFWRFLKFGAVITIVDLVIAFGILALERAVGLPALLGL